jgi:rRNA-processing protein EBP2
MAKKNKKEKKSPKSEEKKPLITMEDLEEMSGDELPPEDEWDEEAKALKEAILGGAYDHLLKREDGGTDDEESIEEIEVRSTDEDSENDGDFDNKESGGKEVVEEESQSHSSEEASESEDKEVGEEEHDEHDDNDDDDDDDEAASDEEDSGSDSDNEESDVHHSSNQQSGSKALHIITNQLIAEKSGWPWAETFAIVAQTPLPFNVEGEDHVDIHDDLKREVAFYDMALESVFQAREQCKKAGISISRPADFFAEMVKSDGE